MQSHRGLFKILVYISKTEGEGPYPNSAEVIGKSCVYFDEVGSSFKNQAGFLILHDKCCSRERESTDRLRCVGCAWPSGTEYMADDHPVQMVGLDVWKLLDFH